MRIKRISNKIISIDWLLIFGIVLAPMTSLRIWKIGPGEVLCLAWAIFNVHSLRVQINVISKFFATFLGAMLIGTIICYFKYPEELRMVDWFTWLFFTFFSCNLYTGLKKRPLEYNKQLLYLISCIAAIWYLFLYVYSIIISPSIAGVRLWYGLGYRFSGGATNPHQISFLFSTISLVFACELARKQHVLRNSILMLCTIYLLRATRSTSGIAALVMGFLALIIVLIVDSTERRLTKELILISGIFISLLFLITGHTLIYKLFMEFMDSDTNGASRLEIFSHIGETFVKSPIFGLGPGVHSFWGLVRIEYHNSFLEILAASGIVGSVALISFLFYIFNLSKDSHWFIPVFISILVYAAAGFVMRRIVFWGITVLAIVIMEEESNKMRTSSQQNIVPGVK